jgi:hypothetical protein
MYTPVLIRTLWRLFGEGPDGERAQRAVFTAFSVFLKRLSTVE